MARERVDSDSHLFSEYDSYDDYDGIEHEDSDSPGEVGSEHSVGLRVSTTVKALGMQMPAEAKTIPTVIGRVSMNSTAKRTTEEMRSMCSITQILVSQMLRC